jgi:glucose/arabinose dehydrogenase
MITTALVRRSMLAAGFIGAALTAWPAPAPAQQPAPLDRRPPSWAQGRPANASNSVLGPFSTSNMAVTPADKLPLDKLQVPNGFKIEVYASGLKAARTIRQGDKGTVFVGSSAAQVVAIVDRDGKRDVKVLYPKLHRPNGLAYRDGTLYIGESAVISKVEHIEDQLDNPPKPVVIYDDLPGEEAHGRKYMTIGPDNKLYLQIGVPCNICVPTAENGQIRRMNLDGSGAEVVGRGIRMIMGMDFSPTTGQLYFTENSRDWFSEDIPEDKLNRMAEPGKDHFGYPYCHQGNIADNEFGWGRSCDEFTKPVGLLGAHSAALGMRFYTGTAFPAQYRDTIFIARHGSWNRTKKTGGDIVVARLNPDGTLKSLEPFVTGFIQNNEYVARAADLEFLKDGSMLISDDFNGAVYRVTYAGPEAAASK